MIVTNGEPCSNGILALGLNNRITTTYKAYHRFDGSCAEFLLNYKS